MSIQVLSSRCDAGYIYDAIIGARLSYASDDQSDTAITPVGDVLIGAADEHFIRTQLLKPKRARGEDKFLRTIPVSAFIRAPLRWWVEMDTYRVAPDDGSGLANLAETAVKQSGSLMHRTQKRGAFTADDFTETTDLRLIEIVNEHYQEWVALGAKRNSGSLEWVALQDAIGRGYLYTAHWTANYAILRNIYQQRAVHRQHEWRHFCAWCETLPESWLITWRSDV